MPDLTQDEAEFQRAWSMKAGERSALKRAIGIIESRSAAAYVARRDEVANALRDAAASLKELEREASKELTAFIDEDNKRRRAQRRPLYYHEGEKQGDSH